MSGSSLISAAQQTNAPASSVPPAQTEPQGTAQPAASPQESTGESASPQQSPNKATDQTSDKDKNSQTGTGKVEGTSNDRLFGALPNFLSLEKGKKLPPLTTKDKFKVVALGTFDYVQYPWWAMLAAIDQADDSERAYGQGWVGYAKRYGTTAADSTIENFMVGAVYPSIFRQDPRFYYSEEGGTARRTGYAISRIFVTHSDSGKAEFNVSEILGSATAAAISTYSYHPRGTYIRTPTNPHLFIPSDRTLANTASVWGTQLTLDTVTLVIKEFWPDVHRKMSRKDKEKSAAITPAPKP